MATTFTFCITLTHSLFSLTQLWLGVLLMDTSTLGQVEQEIEPPTFWFVDNLHEPLSHCRPSNWSGFEQEEVRFLFFFLSVWYFLESMIPCI